MEVKSIAFSVSGSVQGVHPGEQAGAENPGGFLRVLPATQGEVWQKRCPSETSRAQGWSGRGRGQAHLDLFSLWNPEHSGKKAQPFEAAPQSHASGPHNGPVCHSSHTGPEASWLQHPCVWQVSQHLASLLGFLGKGCAPGWQLGWQGRRKEKSQVPGALPPGRTPGPSPLQPLKTTGGNFTITPGKQEG